MIYGFLFSRRLEADIEYMLGDTPGLYWRVMWRFVSPLIVLVIFVASLINMGIKNLTYTAWSPEMVCLTLFFDTKSFESAFFLLVVFFVIEILVSCCKLVVLLIVAFCNLCIFPPRPPPTSPVLLLATGATATKNQAVSPACSAKFSVHFASTGRRGEIEISILGIHRDSFPCLYLLCVYSHYVLSALHWTHEIQAKAPENLPDIALDPFSLVIVQVRIIIAGILLTASPIVCIHEKCKDNTRVFPYKHSKGAFP